MKRSSALGSMAAFAIVLVYLALVFGLPIIVTEVIFENGLWIARIIVYIVSLAALTYGVRQNKLDQILFRWIKKSFGIKVV